MLDCGTAAPRCACSPACSRAAPFLSVLSGDASLRARPDAPRDRAAAAMGASRRRPRRRRRSRRSSSAAPRSPACATSSRGERAGEVGVDAGRPAGVGRDRDRLARASRDHTRADARPRSACRSRSTAAACGSRRRCAGGVPARSARAIRRRPRSSWSRPRSRPAPTSRSSRWRATRTRLGFVDVLRRMGADIEVDRRRGSAAASRSGSSASGRARCTARRIEGDEIPNVHRRGPRARDRGRVRGAASPRSATRPSSPSRRATGSVPCNRSCRSWASRSRPGPTGSSIRGGRAAAAMFEESRRPPHRDGRRGRGQRDRRREHGARLAERCRRRTRSSPTTSPRLTGLRTVSDDGRCPTWSRSTARRDRASRRSRRGVAARARAGRCSTPARCTGRSTLAAIEHGARSSTTSAERVRGSRASTRLPCDGGSDHDRRPRRERARSAART